MRTTKSRMGRNEHSARWQRVWSSATQARCGSTSIRRRSPGRGVRASRSNSGSMAAGPAAGSALSDWPPDADGGVSVRARNVATKVSAPAPETLASRAVGRQGRAPGGCSRSRAVATNRRVGSSTAAWTTTGWSGWRVCTTSRPPLPAPAGQTGATGQQGQRLLRSPLAGAPAAPGRSRGTPPRPPTAAATAPPRCRSRSAQSPNAILSPRSAPPPARPPARPAPPVPG